MNISAPFIKRPVATTLLTIGLAVSGMLAWGLLPVSPLPQVDFPTIQVTATLPGAEPDTMATSVAAPLERQFGHIAGLTEMTSTSYLGSTGIALQFDLSRNIDGAARDVQAAINAARGYLPPALPNNPTYRQTVLAAFQGVEDNLAALRILEGENAVQDEAVTAARKSVDLTTNQYKEGTVSYLNVITVQTIALTDEITAIQIRGRRMAAAVLLVQALGGGWTAADLPSPADVTKRQVPAPRAP
jgi:hypothetical protein